MFLITDSTGLTKSRRDILLESVVIEGWDEVMHGPNSGLINVEYETGDDGSIDFVKVWASTDRGRWDLVCEYWTRPLWSHNTGLRFGTGYHCVRFGEALVCALNVEDSSAKLPNFHGRVQITAPTQAERSEAAVRIAAAFTSCGSPLMKQQVAA